MHKIVMDTNVFISSKLKPQGNPAEIMKLISAGKIELYFTPRILDEFEATLSKPKFKLSVEEQREFVEIIKEVGILIDDPMPGGSEIIEINDPDDRIFYDAARASDAVLVSGDKHLLELDKPFIMKPAEYLDYISL